MAIQCGYIAQTLTYTNEMSLLIRLLLELKCNVRNALRQRLRSDKAASEQLWQRIGWSMGGAGSSVPDGAHTKSLKGLQGKDRCRIDPMRLSVGSYPVYMRARLVL